MADSSIAVLDGTGVSRAVDAQTVGTDFQQTVTIGDGATAGRVAAVTADQALKTVSNVTGTSTLTSVTASATSVTILAANANRRGAIIFNAGSTILYLRYGSTAATTTAGGYSVQVAPTTGVYFLDTPLWNGAITGIWAGAPTGAASVTDLSA